MNGNGRSTPIRLTHQGYFELVNWLKSNSHRADWGRRKAYQQLIATTSLRLTFDSFSRICREQKVEFAEPKKKPPSTKMVGKLGPLRALASAVKLLYTRLGEPIPPALNQLLLNKEVSHVGTVTEGE